MSVELSESGTGLTPAPVSPPSAIVTYGKKVMVAMPWQKQVHPVTAFCVGRLCDQRRTSTMLNYGDAFVPHTRNKCAELFLKTDCEWMLTIDDDMVVPFGNAEWYKLCTGFNFNPEFMRLNAIDRLLSHKKTLVGGLYFGRMPGAKAVYNEGVCNPVEDAYARKAPHNLIKPTRWVGTGCMMIHRSVFEDIEKKFPNLARKDGEKGNWFTSTEATLIEQLTRLRDGLLGKRLDGTHALAALTEIEGILSRARFDNPLGAGEDVSFCLRAQAAGHTPYVDMGLFCGHIGYHCYGPNDGP